MSSREFFPYCCFDLLREGLVQAPPTSHLEEEDDPLITSFIDLLPHTETVSNLIQLFNYAGRE